MSFWKKADNQNYLKDHQELQKQLRQLGKIQFTAKSQQALKRQLFTSIKQGNEEFLPHHLRELAVTIEEVSQQVSLPIYQKVKMKERLFSFIRKTSWLGLAFGPFKNGRFLRTGLSALILLFFVVSSVLVFPFQVPLTYAARLTYLDDVVGNVFVLRNGDLIPAKNDFTLHEGDVVYTKADSYVTIRFFDDSITRLDANTELEVKRLFAEPLNPVASQVELLMGDGHVWARVLNLIDDNAHFVVSTDRASAIVSKKAAFDLDNHVASTTLSVFDNVVDFSVGKDYNSETKPVLAGFQAQVSQKDGSNVAKIVPISEGINGNKQTAQWVEANLQKDKIHSETLLAQNEQDLSNSSGMTDALQQPTDTGSDKALSNPDVEQERQHFLDAYHRLLLGETYLMRQQPEQGLPLVFEFENVVRSIMIHVKDFEAADPLNVGLLRSFIESKVSQQRKDLSTVLPGDSMYVVKEHLDNVEFYLIDSNVDKTKMQLSQSEDRLLEVQDLIAKAKFDDAETILDRYAQKIDQIVLKVNSSNEGELSDNLVAIFDHQVEQIKVLTSIEKSLLESQTQLITKVRSLRETVLQKLMKALEKVNSDVVPVSFIQELKDLLQTYMNNGAVDQDFVASLNKLLLRYGSKSALHGASQKLPTSLGVVTIVEDEATSPVRSTQQQTVSVVQDSGTQVVVSVTQQKIAGSQQTTISSCKDNCASK